MKGLQGNMVFNNLLSYERKTLERLAEIEREDADRCESCGGEDCVCCEYYIDRQKWKSPEELFGHPIYDDWYGYTEEEEID